jgi:hypothetical protein
MEQPHCDWRTFMSATDDTPAETLKKLDDYFPRFVQPTIKGDGGKKIFEPQKCIGCGDELTGFFGTLRWGIAHGEAECGKCGWPVRGHHFISDEITMRNVFLQYHPDFVERRSRKVG